ncbi:hypothetical protein [Streptomyces sp. TLI_185]|uniref:hypothetical protein n=1 Tax=Streptomyces sp. TLI_185 TaxID=2485151 RepID=UPI000F4DB72F|nr:hypothetical protein [Streptomyces sp. TLI_185]RPF35065.1 hypothetical protein EDD92_5061 [Streptomyces sp. TLI_185]
MSSTEALETPSAKRSLSSRLRAHARKAAIPALLLSITVGGLGLSATAHAADAPQCPPNGGAGTCSAPGSGKGKAKVSGDADHPGRLTQGKTQDKTLKLWQGLHFPDWHNVGDRDDSFLTNQWTDQFGVRHQEWVETGGRYWDNGNSLRDFMNSGGAGPSSRNYAGTFQEYVAHPFDHRPQFGERTGSDRFVRAISSGDTWVSYDHYNSFIYLGKFWW